MDVTYNLAAPSGAVFVSAKGLLLAVIGSSWGKHYTGRKVWYWYYDTNGKTDEERDKCLEQNNDIVKLPEELENTIENQIREKELENLETKKIIRRVIIYSHAMEYYLIMNHLFVVKPLLPERLPGQQVRLL